MGDMRADDSDPLAELARRQNQGLPIPLELEEECLAVLVERDPSRMDLKARLVHVKRRLGLRIDEQLVEEVRSYHMSVERSIDFQALMDTFEDEVNFQDMGEHFRRVVTSVGPYTMTSTARLAALWSANDYLVRNGIPGAILEAGVWRGGSMMLTAHQLKSLGAPRDLWLFDTFSGLPRPDDRLDVDIMGNRAIDGWEARSADGVSAPWALASIDEVRSNVAGTGYDMDHVHLVAGLVEETIPSQAPSQIALLRIDTDWHSSYAHILDELYDRVCPGGIVLLDDYGHFTGAKAAVDEFLAKRKIQPLLFRIDYSARMMIR